MRSSFSTTALYKTQENAPPSDRCVLPVRCNPSGKVRSVSQFLLPPRVRSLFSFLTLQHLLLSLRRQLKSRQAARNPRQSLYLYTLLRDLTGKGHTEGCQRIDGVMVPLFGADRVRQDNPIKDTEAYRINGQYGPHYLEAHL